MPESIPSLTGSLPPTTQVELEFALDSAVRELRDARRQVRPLWSSKGLAGVLQRFSSALIRFPSCHEFNHLAIIY